MSEGTLENIAPLKCAGIKNDSKKEYMPDYTIPENCAVCCMKFSEKELHRTLPCNHSFHAACVDVWILRSSTCPICRYQLNERGIINDINEGMPFIEEEIPNINENRPIINEEMQLTENEEESDNSDSEFNNTSDDNSDSGDNSNSDSEDNSNSDESEN